MARGRRTWQISPAAPRASRARVDSLCGTAIRVELQIAFQSRTSSTGVTKRVTEGHVGPDVGPPYLLSKLTEDRGGRERERERERERREYGFIRA